MNSKSTSERFGEALERARRHWRGRQQAVAEEGLHVPASPPAFTIALSREAGANGPAIARAVGARLGWPVYDRELLQRVAEEMGLRTSLLESVDEKKRKGWLRECLDSFFAVPAVTESTYARHLLETLFSLAAHGECVIVGRGAAQVLPAATTLRVRLVGPVKDRIEAIRQRFGVTPEEAAAWIEKTDPARARFVSEHFRKDPSDPRSYDLVLNSSRFSVAECAELIVDALHRLQAHAPAKHPEPATA